VNTPLRGLVVDDDRVFAEDASDLLREKFDSLSQLDISFESCSTYQTARYRLQGARRRQPPYDIVFVDMLFPPQPGRDPTGDRSALVEYGLDIVGWASEARVPVIVGYSQEAPEALARLRRQALEQGAHLFYYRSTLFGPVVAARSAVEEISARLIETDHDGAAPPRAPADRRTVAVVYGANKLAKRSLFTFLRSVNLTPVEWEQAVEWTGHAAPTVPHVLEMLFSRVQAVVVLLSPDEAVRLRASVLDPGQDAQAGFQARPNVYFEAGIAFARHTARTILVEVGDVRPASDLIARYVIRMDNSPEKRQALADRLENAGCDVQRFSDWFTAGDFETGVGDVEQEGT
jgi:predicted nucleotide-binding protein